jgi:hypothetical protein
VAVKNARNNDTNAYRCPRLDVFPMWGSTLERTGLDFKSMLASQDWDTDRPLSPKPALNTRAGPQLFWLILVSTEWVSMYDEAGEAQFEFR